MSKTKKFDKFIKARIKTWEERAKEVLTPYRIHRASILIYIDAELDRLMETIKFKVYAYGDPNISIIDVCEDDNNFYNSANSRYFEIGTELFNYIGKILVNDNECKKYIIDRIRKETGNIYETEYIGMGLRSIIHSSRDRSIFQFTIVAEAYLNGVDDNSEVVNYGF